MKPRFQWSGLQAAAQAS